MYYSINNTVLLVFVGLYVTKINFLTLSYAPKLTPVMTAVSDGVTDFCQ